MRCVGHDLLADQDAGLDELANLMMADFEDCSRVAQCQPLAVLYRRSGSREYHARVAGPQHASPSRSHELLIACESRLVSAGGNIATQEAQDGTAATARTKDGACSAARLIIG